MIVCDYCAKCIPGEIAGGEFDKIIREFFGFKPQLNGPDLHFHEKCYEELKARSIQFFKNNLATWEEAVMRTGGSDEDQETDRRNTFKR